MKIAIMQPYLFPYIGYFQLINLADKFIIYDDVNYINRGWVNRNRILVNRESLYITWPLKEASQNKLINEIERIVDEKWTIKTLKTIETAYKKAPCFENVYPLIKEIITYPETNLSKYINNSIATLCEYMGVSTTFEASSSVYNNNHLKAEERIIDICIQEKAGEYINPSGGTHLYNLQNFGIKNIKLKYIHSQNVSYPQFKNNFVPFLSIIDVLMFCKKEAITQLLQAYELREQ